MYRIAALEEIVGQVESGLEPGREIKTVHHPSTKYKLGDRVGWINIPLSITEEPTCLDLIDTEEDSKYGGRRLLRCWYMDALPADEEDESSFALLRSDIERPFVLGDSGVELRPGTYKAVLDCPHNDDPLLSHSSFHERILPGVKLKRDENSSPYESLFLRR